jgi:hypothetical protein
MTSGALWIKTGMCRMSWFGPGGIRRPRSNSSAGCCKGASMYPGCSLQITSRAMALRRARSCPVSSIVSHDT